MAEKTNDDVTPLADRLVPDPANPPELSLLQGWLGKSSEEKHRRLYLDPELTQSLEIPEEAIVHVLEVSREENPLGGDRVWVKADAAIKQGPGLERLYARFLRGQIQQDYFGAAAAGTGNVGGGLVGAPGLGGATSPLICRPVATIANCATQQIQCQPSASIICASQLTNACITRQPALCQVATAVGPQCQPSVSIICASQLTNACFTRQPVLCQVATAAGPQCQPSVSIICASQLTNACFTRQPGGCQVVTAAGPQCTVSAAIACPTRICPSAVDACPSAPGGCWDPTAFEQPFFQQPMAQPGFQAGLGFDPGAGGGLVGAPAPATSTPQCQFVTVAANCQTQFVMCQASAILQLCPTRTPICVSRLIVACPTMVQQWCPTLLPQLCRTQTPQLCPTVTPQWCGPSFPGFCPTLPGGCPTSVGGCPSGPVCVDPGGLAALVNPGDFAAGGGFAGGFDPTGGAGMAGAFDPSGGLVGAAAGQGFELGASLQVATRFVICQRTIFVPLCPTVPPQCAFSTAVPQCVSRFCTFVNCPSVPPFVCRSVAICP